MNKDNILKVADAIEAACAPDAKPVMGFNMNEWVARNNKGAPDHTGHNCETVACVAGWAEYIATGKKPVRGSYPERSAAVFLGLDDRKATSLFYARGAWKTIERVQPQQAVRTLRHLAETGKVDWTICAPQTEGAAS